MQNNEECTYGTGARINGAETSWRIKQEMIYEGRFQKQRKEAMEAAGMTVDYDIAEFQNQIIVIKPYDKREYRTDEIRKRSRRVRHDKPTR